MVLLVYYNVMCQCVKQIVCFIHSEINCCCKIQQETLSYTCIYFRKTCLSCEADQWFSQVRRLRPILQWSPRLIEILWKLPLRYKTMFSYPPLFTHTKIYTYRCACRMIMQLLMFTDNQHCMKKQMYRGWQQATAYFACHNAVPMVC